MLNSLDSIKRHFLSTPHVKYMIVKNWFETWIHCMFKSLTFFFNILQMTKVILGGKTSELKKHGYQMSQHCDYYLHYLQQYQWSCVQRWKASWKVPRKHSPGIQKFFIFIYQRSGVPGKLSANGRCKDWWLSLLYSIHWTKKDWKGIFSLTTRQSQNQIE